MLMAILLTVDDIKIQKNKLTPIKTIVQMLSLRITSLKKMY